MIDILQQQFLYYFNMIYQSISSLDHSFFSFSFLWENFAFRDKIKFIL